MIRPVTVCFDGVCGGEMTNGGVGESGKINDLASVMRATTEPIRATPDVIAAPTLTFCLRDPAAFT